MFFSVLAFFTGEKCALKSAVTKVKKFEAELAKILSAEAELSSGDQDHHDGQESVLAHTAQRGFDLPLTGEFLFTDDFLTINVPVVYMGRDIWIWMGEKSITRVI